MTLVADWATTAALLAVLLAEGIRRLPAGAIVLRRTIRGGWRIVHGPTARTEWRLVGIWAPFFEHLVIRADTPADFLPTDAGDQTRECRPLLPSRLTIAGFRVAGGATLLIVALGVPVATATLGVDGLIRSLIVAFFCSTLAACAMAAYLARSAGGWKAASAGAMPLLSPFAAPRAAEMLLQTVVNGLPAPAALHALVPQKEYERWFRVHAYDALAARSAAPDGSRSPRLEAIIAAVPESCGHGDRFCPRCAAVFLANVEDCSDCTSVVLRLHPAPGTSPDAVAKPDWGAFPTDSRTGLPRPRYVN